MNGKRVSFIFVIGILYLLNTVFCQDPEIVDEIWPEVRPIGRTGQINCTVVRLGTNTVEWYQNNTQITISQGQTIQVLNPRLGGLRKYEVLRTNNGDRVTFTLQIRRLRQQDAGNYKCTVRVQAVSSDKWPYKYGSLIVQVAPTIKTGGTTAVLQISENDSDSLTCDATGIPSPNITWTRSDGGLLPTKKPAAQYRGRTLPLVSVTVEHMGVYRCVADNNIKPPAEHLAEVRVFHAPHTRVVQNSVGQAQNMRLSAKLECIVQGHPEPTVTWYRVVENSLVRVTDDDFFDINKQTQDNQNLKAMDNWYTLKVKNIQANDFTTYYCIAENTYGKHNSTIVLFETTECQGPNCPSLSASKAPDSVVISLSSVVLGLIAVFYIQITL